MNCIELTCAVDGFGVGDVESLAVCWRALVIDVHPVGFSTTEVVSSNNTSHRRLYSASSSL